MAVLLAPTSKNAVQKTLAAQLLSSAGNGDPISFDDVDGVPNLPGVLVINRIDSNGNATPSSREYIEYSGTSGNTVIIETRNVDSSNSALTHAVGSIVEFIADVTWANRIYTALSTLVDIDDITVINPAVVTNPLSATSHINSSGATISAILDEDTMVSNRADAVPTQQSVKAYVDPGVTTITSSATPTPTGNKKNNELYVTALAEASELQAPSGTPANGNKLIVRIKDDGTARALTYNAIYSGIVDTLPATTTISKVLYMGFIYNSTITKWEMVALTEEA